MISDILTLTPTDARDIPPFTIVQIWDEYLSATRMVMCKGHTFHWSVFAYDNGYTFRVPGYHSLRVVTGIDNWNSLSAEARMDIELDLMTRGA